MDAIAVMESAKAHANLHLKQGCQELVTWDTTGVLPGGVVRETAEILNDPFGDDALKLAERIYERAAIRCVAEGMQPPVIQAALQQAYNKLWGGCLCGHFESCAFCDGSMDQPRKELEAQAKALGFILKVPGVG